MKNKENAKRVDKDLAEMAETEYSEIKRSIILRLVNKIYIQGFDDGYESHQTEYKIKEKQVKFDPNW